MWGKRKGRDGVGTHCSMLGGAPRGRAVTRGRDVTRCHDGAQNSVTAPPPSPCAPVSSRPHRAIRLGVAWTVAILSCRRPLLCRMLVECLCILVT